MVMNKLALVGGTPVRTKPFPAWPQFDEREVEAVASVVRSGQWGRLAGTEVAQLEKEFAAAHDAKYALGVTNGTTALEVALLALGIGPGDEVIVPAYTFVASATCVLTVNAIPVFADIDLDTFNIDLDSVRAKITPRTKAIIPVHFAGLPVNMDELLALAREHNLHVVEDTAHGHGAKWRGKGVGSHGEFGAFSFQASKNMNSGEGGIVITNDHELYERANSLHSFGRLPGRPGTSTTCTAATCASRRCRPPSSGFSSPGCLNRTGCGLPTPNCSVLCLGRSPESPPWTPRRPRAQNGSTTCICSATTPRSSPV